MYYYVLLCIDVVRNTSICFMCLIDGRARKFGKKNRKVTKFCDTFKT